MSFFLADIVFHVMDQNRDVWSTSPISSSCSMKGHQEVLPELLQNSEKQIRDSGTGEVT